MGMDTNRYHCKAAGFCSLTPEGDDYITFMKNSTKETIMDLLIDLRKRNPDEIIFLLIDNFPSHKANDVKNLAIELHIELTFLPAYSPHLQPIEKYGIKQKEIICNTKLVILKISKKWMMSKN